MMTSRLLVAILLGIKCMCKRWPRYVASGCVSLLIAFAMSEGRAQTASSRTKVPRSLENKWTGSMGMGLGLESLVSGRSDFGAPATDERGFFEYGVRSPVSSRFGFQSSGKIGVPFSSLNPSSSGRELLIEIPELYFSWTDAPASDTATFIVVGRNLEKWSELDSQWTLGLWQPLHHFDSLRPVEQGLTGAFLGHKGQGFRAFLFASPLYIPEQGPAYALEGGRFHAKNPWFSPPTDRLIILNRENQIRYTLEAPSVGSVVGNGSFGALMRLGSEGATQEGLGVSLAYTHKPRNPLSLPYDGYVDLKSAHVNIIPRVVYHDLYSFDLGYGQGDWRVSLATLVEIPDQMSQVPQGLTGEVLGPVTFVSPSAEARLFSRYFWGPKVKVSWLDSFEEGTQMVGPLGSGGESPFGSRTMYRNAFGLEISSTLYRNWNWSMDQNIKWIEEFAEDGRVVMFDIGVAFRKTWRLGFYADLLQSRQPEDSNPGFISRFRGNDRVGSTFMLYF